MRQQALDQRGGGCSGTFREEYDLHFCRILPPNFSIVFSTRLLGAGSYLHRRSMPRSVGSTVDSSRLGLKELDGNGFACTWRPRGNARRKHCHRKHTTPSLGQLALSHFEARHISTVHGTSAHPVLGAISSRSITRTRQSWVPADGMCCQQHPATSIWTMPPLPAVAA